MKVHKGDTVKILSGKDRAKLAKVLRVFPTQERILVEGVNLKKKHRRSRRQDRKGEIMLFPAPISSSAVEVLCSSCGKPTRVGYMWDETGKKARKCKKCGKTL
ncbi:MAG: 50S ribosomal protein L24 [Patescibacteria group bacterium]